MNNLERLPKDIVSCLMQLVRPMRHNYCVNLSTFLAVQQLSLSLFSQDKICAGV